MTMIMHRPWFRARPGLTIFVACGLFVAIFLLRLLVSAPNETVLQLLALPITLVAMAFGRRAGVTAATIGVVALLAWVLIADVQLTPLGWGARILPMVLLGVLVGDATDRLRTAEQTRFRLQQAQVRRREAAEINDTIVQNLAVAKWMLESGESARGLQAVDDALVMAQQLVSDMLGGSDGEPDAGLPDPRVSLPVLTR